MARNLRQVHDLTLTRVRESTVVADFADVDTAARTASFHHVRGQSRKRNQEFLFQGVDLEVTFFESFFHLTLYEQPHFLSVCGDSVSDAHLASRRYSDSLSLSHTLSLFQIRSGPSLRFF